MSSAQPFGPFHSIATGTYSDLVRTVEIRDTGPTMIPAACETSGSQVDDLTSSTPWKSLHLFPNFRRISIDFSPSRGPFTQEDFICSLGIKLSNLNLHFLASLTLDFPTATMFNYFVYNKAAQGTNCGREVSEPVAALIGRLSVLQLYLPASERAPKPDWYGDVRNISDDGLCELVCLAKNARAVRIAFKCCKDGLEPPKSCLACTMVRSIAWPDDLDLPGNGKLEHLDLGQTKGAERAVEKMVEANLQSIRSITGLKGSTEQNLLWRPGFLNLLTSATHLTQLSDSLMYEIFDLAYFQEGQDRKVPEWTRERQQAAVGLIDHLNGYRLMHGLEAYDALSVCSHAECVLIDFMYIATGRLRRKKARYDIKRIDAWHAELDMKGDNWIV